nr:SDR family NAD(P)-dependent oxidoreductase [Frankia gtarii]
MPAVEDLGAGDRLGRARADRRVPDEPGARGPDREQVRAARRARTPVSVDLPGAIAVQLDVTDPASIAAAVAATGDATVLINNAGIANGASLESGAIADIRAHMDVQYFGTLEVTRAFAPQLVAAGAGAVVNILSAASWFSEPSIAPYAASKAAQWSLTNAQRIWLAGQGTAVTGVHIGLMDTDMTRGIDLPKLDPASAAKITLDGVQAGAFEILVDETSVQLLAGLSGGVAAIYPTGRAGAGSVDHQHRPWCARDRGQTFRSASATLSGCVMDGERDIEVSDENREETLAYQRMMTYIQTLHDAEDFSPSDRVPIGGGITAPPPPVPPAAGRRHAWGWQTGDKRPARGDPLCHGVVPSWGTGGKWARHRAGQRAPDMDDVVLGTRPRRGHAGSRS